MDVSMDGLRKNMVSAYNDLAEYICDNDNHFINDNPYFEKDQLIEKMNELSMPINFLNYIFNKDDKDFQVLENNDTVDFKTLFNKVQGLKG